MSAPARPGAATAALLLGIGLGGFVDGIVLHQVLQWHNMLSAVHPPESMANMRLNMRADGLFHAGVWLATASGLALLWREARAGRVTGAPTRRFVGLLIAGWGLFNLVEGLIDHHLLGIHHVREGPDPLAWDLGFLLFGGLGLIALGTALARGAAAPR